MKVEAPSLADLRFVAERMRESDVEEFLPLSVAETREQLAAMLVSSWAARPDLIGAYDGDEAIAIGAMVEGRPNVVSLLFFATDRFIDIAAPLTRFIRQRVFPAYVANGIHRIECVSLASYTSAHRWIRALGLAQEAEFPGYGKGGETYLQFAWVADVRPSGT